MEAKELMIGDWVLLKSNGVMPDTIMQIEEISKEGVFVTDCDNLIGFHEIEPIPLTEEILEENDFKYRGHYLVLDWSTEDIMKKEYESNYIQMLKYSIIGDLRVFWRSIVIKNSCRLNITIKYAHEFQQALRVCGLRKLADNFKIE